MLKVGFKKQNNNNKKNPNLKQKNKTYFPEINKVISFCLFTRCTLPRWRTHLRVAAVLLHDQSSFFVQTKQYPTGNFCGLLTHQPVDGSFDLVSVVLATGFTFRNAMLPSTGKVK